VGRKSLLLASAPSKPGDLNGRLRREGRETGKKCRKPARRSREGSIGRSVAEMAPSLVAMGWPTVNRTGGHRRTRPPTRRARLLLWAIFRFPATITPINSNRGTARTQFTPWSVCPLDKQCSLLALGTNRIPALLAHSRNEGLTSLMPCNSVRTTGARGPPLQDWRAAGTRSASGTRFHDVLSADHPTQACRPPPCEIDRAGRHNRGVAVALNFTFVRVPRPPMVSRDSSPGLRKRQLDRHSVTLLGRLSTVVRDSW